MLDVGVQWPSKKALGRGMSKLSFAVMLSKGHGASGG